MVEFCLETTRAKVADVEVGDGFDGSHSLGEHAAPGVDDAAV